MGVDAIKSRGGTVIVQDPEEAEFSGMPSAAVATGSADLVLPLSDIADAIKGLIETGGS
jgi:two-component system chemotaxis response regulator CheB